MSEYTHHNVGEDGRNASGKDPELGALAEHTLQGSGRPDASEGKAVEAPDPAQTDKLLSAQLRVDVADPSTKWEAYNSPPIGLVTPSTVRSTKPGRQPTTPIDAEHRKNKVGGPDGEQLGVPDAVLRKPGTVVKPRTPEIRQGLAAGEGMLLRFARPDKPEARVVYFLDEAARRVDLVAIEGDGTTNVRTITDPALAPKGFTIGESGQVDPAVSGSLSRLELVSVELPSTMMQRLGVIDNDGIPTTVPHNSANIQFQRFPCLIDQARFALEARAGLQGLPTTPP